MADPIETFRSTATIYSGGGVPFPPGAAVPLPASHVKALTEAGLAQPAKAAPVAPAPAKKS